MSGTDVPWGDLVREATSWRTRLAHVSSSWPLTIPRIGADDAAIAAAQARIGFELDAQHEALLREINGWPDAFLEGTVLGTDEIGAGELWERAWVHLDTASDYFDELPPLEELVPICVSDVVLDTSAVWMNGPVTDGGFPVIRMTSTDSDEFENVHAWWRECVQTTRDLVALDVEKNGITE
ncbi:hypothetical protein CLV28_1690 [Sediminihabitans luteus]|uniref:SMI1/KNR4 family protein SUKH-1 n=1 Tax=Sediminihabitans luteus TaxID=1138585 RepID=A0A2M9CQJ5_9CELL|nr:hypothetical protein [Sediminihabitans luteus]PJJ74196.1 hypothetical protein CLV28_1690 [Sediminihabitans luteus]GII99049.1 hypothetical protein Slu03_14270 [Sediminihabitans luteus]